MTGRDASEGLEAALLGDDPAIIRAAVSRAHGAVARGEEGAGEVAAALDAASRAGARRPELGQLVFRLAELPPERTAGVDPKLLERWCGAEGLGGLGRLAAAAMLSRVNVNAFDDTALPAAWSLTEALLFGAEHPDVDEEARRRVSLLAVELWANIGAASPELLLQLLSHAVALGGWAGPLARCLAEALLAVLPLSPGLAIAMERVLAPPPGTEEAEERAARLALVESVGALSRARAEAAARREVIHDLAARFADAGSEAPEPEAPEPEAPPLSAADAALVRRFLDGDAEAQREAWRTLVEGRSSSAPALPACADASLAAGGGERFEAVLEQLGELGEAVVPAATLSRWLDAASALRPDEVLALGRLLARADVARLAGSHLGAVLEAALASPMASLEIWSALGRNAPEALRAIASTWIARFGWDDPLVRALAHAMVLVAEERPEEAAAMIAVVEAAGPSEGGLRASASPAQVKARLERLGRR